VPVAIAVRVVIGPGDTRVGARPGPPFDNCWVGVRVETEPVAVPAKIVFGTAGLVGGAI
jgi:hypothetical protein